MRRLMIIGVAALCAACAGDGPPCPVEDAMVTAFSAGCFAVLDNRLLLVQGHNDKISLPGGLSLSGEPAACTAFRETWEETGLQLQPRELLSVFDTGFHLYRCAHHAGSGVVDRLRPFEIQRVLYLSPEEFGNYQWRFDEQMVLQEMMLEGLGR